MRNTFYKLLIIVFIVLSCNTVSKKEKTENQEIGTYINHIIDHYEMIGGAIAILKSNELVYSNYFGIESIDTQNPVNENTLFRLHSLSKIFVATYIFKEIEEEKLSLEDEIGKYLSNLPADWRTIKISNLLSHSSGLPDIRNFEGLTEEEVKKQIFQQEIRFEPNHHFQYNQINFWLLNKLIEEISGKDFASAVLDSQFENYKSTVEFKKNNLSGYNNYAIGYKLDHNRKLKIDNFTVPNYIFGAAGLNITLREFINWSQKLQDNKILQKETKKEMWASNRYDSPHTNDYALGWDIRMLNNKKSIGFNGGGKVAYRIFPEEEITIIFLTNGSKYETIIETNINRIASMIDSTLSSENELVREQMWESLIKDKDEESSSTYNQLKAKYKDVNLEEMINGMGYDLLYGYEQVQTAKKAFKLNIRENPNSWNVFDSMGEFYERTKELEKAIASYKKAMELNKSNQYQRNDEIIKIITRLKNEN